VTISGERDHAPSGAATAAGPGNGAGPGGGVDGVAPTVVLQPVAAPSILGLYGFTGATLIVAANLAGWYGNTSSPQFLFPFAMFFGGLAQFLAGMWAYRARDSLATAMHGMWGSFWLAYGLLQLLFATHVLTEPKGAFPELGFWFIALGAITAVGALAALMENLALFVVLGFLAAGSIVAAIGFIGDYSGADKVAGWLFVMLAATAKRVVLPLGKYHREANIPGGHPTRAIQYEWAEPGIRMGQ
jgi:uncharacterized protein